MIFLNDGPGLLLGSMWNDYAHIEESWPGRVKVVTLRMVQRENQPRLAQVEEKEAVRDMATGVPKKRRQGRTAVAFPRHNRQARPHQCGWITPGRRPMARFWPKAPPRLHAYGPMRSNVAENRLYFGDNLGILASLLRDKEVLGKVRLVYIDPPFATQTMFHSRKLEHAYEDTFRAPSSSSRCVKRLVILHELMARDGSIYLHLDEKMIFHMKIVMDEIFGPENYRNCITRKKCNPKNYTRKTYGNVSDFILFYTKSETTCGTVPWKRGPSRRAKEYQYVEPETGRRFMKVPVHAPGVRNGATGTPWRGVRPPPGKHWQFPPKTLDEMDARGEIFWSANGNPRRKVYWTRAPVSVYRNLVGFPRCPQPEYPNHRIPN